MVSADQKPEDDFGVYWAPVAADRDDLHPRLLQDISAGQLQKMRLYTATVYDGEDGVPNGWTIEFGIDAANSVACGVMREYTITDGIGGFTDVATDPVWFSCADDPDEVSQTVYDKLAPPAA